MGDIGTLIKALADYGLCVFLLIFYLLRLDKELRDLHYEIRRLQGRYKDEGEE